METVINYILIFFSYAFAGWIIEVTLKLIQYRRFINRGFLAGPWLPIYGFGALLITAAVRRHTRNRDVIRNRFCRLIRALRSR